MSDFITTTEQVRRLYILGRELEREQIGIFKSSNGEREGRDFDRWLAEHDRQVESRLASRLTREKIAAALHGDGCPDDPDDGELCSCDGDYYYRQADTVLALLTEENQ